MSIHFNVRGGETSIIKAMNSTKGVRVVEFKDKQGFNVLFEIADTNRHRMMLTLSPAAINKDENTYVLSTERPSEVDCSLENLLRHFEHLRRIIGSLLSTMGAHDVITSNGQLYDEFYDD